jgi:hypothetical protein
LSRFDLSLQERARNPHAWSLREKYDLAGNAFAATCSLAFITAMVVSAPFEAAFADEVQVGVVPVPHSDAESNESEAGEEEDPVLDSDAEAVGSDGDVSS